MLDTNVLVRAMRRGGGPYLRRLQQGGETLAVSTIVLQELLVGAELTSRPTHHREIVRGLVARLKLLAFDQGAAEHSGSIRAALQQRGDLIGVNDMHIAGHARSLNLKLVTSDLADFSRVDGLVCEDWVEEAAP